MNITEIMRIIHEEGVENEIFELLTQWMISDRFENMKKAKESKAKLRVIHKIATQNKDTKNAMLGIINLSEEEE